MSTRTGLATGALAIAALACGGDEPAPSGSPDPRPAPTFHGDVEPILQRACSDCHDVAGAAGYPFDARAATALSGFIAARVAARDMPPWLPGPLGAPLAGSRALPQADVDTIVAWAGAGAPLGDPVAPPTPRRTSTFDAGRPPDLRLEMADADLYARPAGPVSDDIRCFVLPLPERAAGAWVTAARYLAGTPPGIHHVSGAALDAREAARARALYGRDARAGFDCTGGVRALVGGVPLGASAAGAEDGSAMPEDAGVLLREGGAVLLAVHYAPLHLGRARDRSGVELWVTREPRRPLLSLAVEAPVELPCPTGPASDPADPCSRDHAYATLPDGARARARTDALFAACGRTPEVLTGAARAASGDGTELLVSTSCSRPAPIGGTVRLARVHMHTKGVSARVEVEQDDESWRVVLDVPRWKWGWEGAYALAEGVTVRAGRRLRVSCTYDNGADNQWSAVTGEPGHGARPAPPLVPPAYVAGGLHRAAEACAAELTIERAPNLEATWATPCEEARAVAGEICGAAPAALGEAGCEDEAARASAVVLASTAEQIRRELCDRAAPPLTDRRGARAR